MGGIIVVIIIVIVFVMKSVQQKGGNSQGSTDRNENYGNSQKAGSYRYSGATGNTKRSGSAGSTRNSSSLGNDKYSGYTSGRINSDISRTSREDIKRKSISRDSPEKNLTDIRMAAGIDEDDGAILSAAKMNSYVTEMDNKMDSQEDLMKPVYDMMIIGPDTSLPSGRDFVAEATDMLNSFTTKAD